MALDTARSYAVAVESAAQTDCGRRADPVANEAISKTSQILFIMLLLVLSTRVLLLVQNEQCLVDARDAAEAGAQRFTIRDFVQIACRARRLRNETEERTRRQCFADSTIILMCRPVDFTDTSVDFTDR
jgi:hypothetical protein